MRTTLRLGLAALFAFTFASIGCKSEPPPEKHESPSGSSGKVGNAAADDSAKAKPEEHKKPVPKTPDGVKLTWTKTPGSTQDLKIENTKVTGDFTCYTLDCPVTLKELPEDTKVKIGANETKADDRGRVTINVEMGDAIAATKPADALSLDKAVDPKQKLEITFPDGVKLEGDLPPIPVKLGLLSALKKNPEEGKPLLFGKESVDDKPAQHTIIFPYGMLVEDALVGSGKTMHDADLVAIEKGLPERPANKKCSGYKASGDSGPGRDLDLYLVDWEVKLIERRTGKELESKKFEADGQCPLIASDDRATSYPSVAAVKLWLRTKR